MKIPNSFFFLIVFLLSFTSKNVALAQCTVSGPSSICEGTSDTYSQSGGASGGSWSVDPAAAGSISSSGSFTASFGYSGSATITYTETGCTGTTTINITPLVLPTFFPAVPYCAGAFITPLPTTSTNMSPIIGTWAPAINNTSTTTYTFTPIDGQCATTNTLTIGINALPTMSVVSACAGGVNSGTIITTASPVNGGILSYTINGSSDADGDQTNLPNGNYTIVVTEAPSGCSNSQSVTVNCNCPTIIINGPTTLCQTVATTTYTQFGASAGGSWSVFPSSAGTITLAGVFTPNATYSGTATISYTVSGCAGTLNININSQPVTISIVSDCLGGLNSGTINTTATSNSGGTLTYSINGLADADGDLTNLANGPYTVVVTEAPSGCSSYQTTTVNCNCPTITVSGPTTLCRPAAATAYTQVGASAGGTWSLAPSSAGIITTDGIFTPNATFAGAVSIIYTATDCIGSINITIIPPVTPTFALTGPFCAGANIAALPTSSTNTPPITGTWAPAINNTSTTTYTFTPIDGQCATPTTRTITINAIPAISVVSDCIGVPNTGSINTTATAGSGGTLTYNINATADPDGDVSFLPNGNYTVVVTESPSGCTNSQSVTVNCNCLWITVAGPTTLCQTAATTTYTQSGGAAGGSWSVLPSSAGTITSAGVFTPNATYSGSATISYAAVGCVGSISISINQQQVTPTFVPAGPYCVGAVIPPLPTSSTNMPPITGTWMPAINNTSSGTYTFTPTVGQCATTATRTITISPIPTIIVVAGCTGGLNTGTINTTATTGSGGTLTYNINGVADADGDQTNLANGPYTVVVTETPSGCSNSQTVIVNCNCPNPDECGVIKGKIYADSNNDCTFQSGEQGQYGSIIKATGQGTVYYGNSNGNGDYSIQVPYGNFVVMAPPPNPLWQSCQASYSVTVTALQDSAVVNMGQKIAYECSALEVHLNTNLLRRCFISNYFVNYCNHGTIAADAAYIIVDLDDFLQFQNSSLPSINLGNNQYRFEVGDLAPGECGNFSIQVYVSCDAVLGQTHCSQATIYPYDGDCAGTDPNWSGASLNIEAECGADSLRFTLRNTGTAAMTIPINYTIVEDMTLYADESITPPLGANASLVIAVPANGATWHIEAEQEPFHPGNNQPSMTIEGCTPNNNFTIGLANQFSPNDADPWLDINCRQNIGAYDPNDKTGYPTGYGSAHYVKPGTPLEYVIRFQNTGTDTAFNIRVVDTLSAWLDPTTIQLGAYSHAYDFSIKKNGILEFAFNDIMLPDSNINEVASHGFLSFSIAPKADMPLSTEVQNSAAIYFDFNDPIITNTTLHTFAEISIALGAWQPVSPGFQVAVYPNPVVTQANIVLQGYQNPNADLRLVIYNVTGSLVKSYTSQHANMVIDRAQLPEGMYIFTITDAQEGLLGLGKLMVK